MTGWADRLSLAGKRVLVTGGGGRALRALGSLRGTGADVVLAAATVDPALQDLADRGELSWLARPAEPADVAQAWLVMTCSDDASEDVEVAGWAEAQRIWCTSVTYHAKSSEGGARSGRVVLVGGGPGDPGLLTLRGMEALSEADVVITDRLAPVSVLARLDHDVEVVDVSKVPRGRSTPQERINELLVEHARRGRVVVRLKGGDGFVFGRGMEEVLACEEAGIGVEVVPGVTSGTAVPALAGVPVTHRELSQGLTMVSGHVPPGDPRSTVDWAALARSGTTLVLMMAVETLPEIAEALVDGGLPPSTPVACIQDGGLPSQRVVTGTLADIGSISAATGLRPPAVTVVGEVAAFARAVAPTVRP